MFEYRNGRTLDITRPVRLYRNLHRNGPAGQPVYSVAQKDARGHWRVIGYTEHAVLRDGRFVVNKGGQAVVRRTGKKAVHAFAQGHLVPWHLAQQGWLSATYNPYRNDTFVDRATGEALHEAPYIGLNEKGAWYIPELGHPVH